MATLPVGGMPILSEIIGRSLFHIQTSRAPAKPERRAGEECEFEIAPGVSIVMCWIPPGEFLMGSPEDEDGRDDDEKQHRVRITKGFWLAKTPVTQAQWEAVMGYNPSLFKGADLPVECESWLDVCWDETRTDGFLGTVNRTTAGGGRWDLPTEAQWEYACRAGTAGIFAGALTLDEIAWYEGNSGKRPPPVGHKKPNAWGLHDMLGNIWEWCSDWYEEYSDESETDPVGPSSGASRVFRGGSWSNNAYRCRPAQRNLSPRYAYDYVGFRIARSSVP